MVGGEVSGVQVWGGNVSGFATDVWSVAGVWRVGLSWGWWVLRLNL